MFSIATIKLVVSIGKWSAAGKAHAVSELNTNVLVVGETRVGQVPVRDTELTSLSGVSDQPEETAETQASSLR